MHRQYSDEERLAIVASMMPPVRQNRDFTLDEYVEMMRTAGYAVSSRDVVRDRLNKLVEQGKLEKLRAWDNETSHVVVVYREIEEVPSDD